MPSGTHHQASKHPHIVGKAISTYSRHIVVQLAEQAKLHRVIITSVRRTVEDQARIFYHKHVVEKTPPHYGNHQVGKMIAHARKLYAKGSSEQAVQAYLESAIEHVRGGPASISRHLLHNPSIEVFDVAHYSGPVKGPKRHNLMTDEQARAFLEACRALIPSPIDRLGHSAELGITMPPREFKDEKCFHLEIKQPVYDSIVMISPNRYA